VPFKYATPMDRILANTVIAEDSEYNGSKCWVWVGRTKTNASGMRYGCISLRHKSGPRKGKVYTMLVHRYVLRVIKGLRMTRKSVGRHLCNNSLCCHPEHLAGGSIKTNNRDTVKAGRHRNGST